ncbi:MAG: hypothetical protein K1X78_21915 [Verrucomicrobiaceae bacterium]|nr:hypothetical protein [Verrucomicrobiaceae bacterium]
MTTSRFLTHLVAVCLALALHQGAASAQQSEYIIVSGGPALRQWENLRKPGEQHDRWWGNFVRTARVRIEEIQKQQPPGTLITWLVYRDSYLRRTAEDKQPLISNVESVRDKYKIRLVWFHTGDDVINYINGGLNRGSTKISGFEYFGHSNKFCFMFDYSSDTYGVSSCWLHEADLKKIHRGAFARNAYCQSWGCHTGESMSALWKKATGVPMVGAFGKTDYSDMHLRNWHVGLSPGSHWRKG